MGKLQFRWFSKAVQIVVAGVRVLQDFSNRTRMTSFWMTWSTGSVSVSMRDWKCVGVEVLNANLKTTSTTVILPESNYSCDG